MQDRVLLELQPAGGIGFYPTRQTDKECLCRRLKRQVARRLPEPATA